MEGVASKTQELPTVNMGRENKESIYKGNSVPVQENGNQETPCP